MNLIKCLTFILTFIFGFCFTFAASATVSVEVEEQETPLTRLKNYSFQFELREELLDTLAKRFSNTSIP